MWKARCSAGGIVRGAVEHGYAAEDGTAEVYDLQDEEEVALFEKTMSAIAKRLEKGGRG